MVAIQPESPIASKEVQSVCSLPLQGTGEDVKAEFMSENHSRTGVSCVHAPLSCATELMSCSHSPQQLFAGVAKAGVTRGGLRGYGPGSQENLDVGRVRCVLALHFTGSS